MRLFFLTPTLIVEDQKPYDFLLTEHLKLGGAGRRGLVGSRPAAVMAAGSPRGRVMARA